MMMITDIVVAGESARLGQPEVRVGIMPGSGGTQRLPRAIGKYKAMKFLLTGDWITGRQAHDMGLVSEVVADDQVEARAIALAAQIAALPPLAVLAIKEVVLAGAEGTVRFI